MRTATGAAVLAGLLALTACQAKAPAASFGSSAPLTQPSWATPDDPVALAEEAGLVPDKVEHLTTHLHAHLHVFVDGQAVVIPAGIGIAVSLKGVKDEPTPDGTEHFYSVSTCEVACLSPLHTHQPDGVIHEESPETNHPPYTLGQFFTEFGVRLDANCVGEFCRPDALIHVYLDGKPHSGDPSEIPLTNHLEIAIVIGQPPVEIPFTWTFFDP
ncbi:MAG: hypothetical protein ABI864_05990 [Chloroflexota bacterium]